MVPAKGKLDQLIDSLKRAKGQQLEEQPTRCSLPNTSAANDNNEPRRKRPSNEHRSKNCVTSSSATRTEEIGGCRKCQMVFHSELDLLEHVIGHYPNQFYLSSSSNSSSEKQTKRVEEEEEEATPSSTTDTLAADQLQSPYQCPYCILSFGGAIELNSHLAFHLLTASLAQHPLAMAPPPLHCVHCRQSFRDALVYRKHVEQLRCVAAQQYHCWVCGEVLNTEFELNRHMSSHTGGTFECATCGRCFMYKVQLLGHATKEHGPNNKQAALLLQQQSEIGKRSRPDDSTCLKVQDDNAEPAEPPVEVRQSVDEGPLDVANPNQDELQTKEASVSPCSPNSVEVDSDQFAATDLDRPKVHSLQNKYLDNLLGEVTRKASKRRRIRSNWKQEKPHCVKVSSPPDNARMMPKTAARLPPTNVNTVKRETQGVPFKEQLLKPQSQKCEKRALRNSEDAKKCSEEKRPSPLKNDYLNTLFKSNVLKHASRQYQAKAVRKVL